MGRPRVPSPRHTSGCSSTDGRKLRLASLEAGTCRPQGDCGCGGHTGSHKNTRSGNGATVGLRSEKSLAQGQWVNKDLDEKGHKGQVSPTMKALSLCGDSPHPPIRAMRATQNLKAKCSTTSSFLKNLIRYVKILLTTLSFLETRTTPRATEAPRELLPTPPDLTAGGQGPGGRARIEPPTPKVKSGDQSRRFHQPAARRPHVATRAQRSPRAQGKGSTAHSFPAPGSLSRQI